MKYLTVVLVCFALVSVLNGSPKAQCWACSLDPTTPPPHCFICAYNQQSGGDNCYTPHCFACTLGSVCGVGGGCFLKGTPIEAPGGLVTIETLRPGDAVVSSVDGDIGFVTGTYRVIACGYYLINGTIRVTGTHPFYVDGEWVMAEELEVGDRIASRNGEAIVVDSIALQEFVRRAYSIEVSGDHTFFAHGALVHNKPPNYQ